MLIRNRKLMPSFFSPAGQNFTSVGSFHSFAKTVHAFSAAFMRLVCSFFTWHFIKIFLYKLINHCLSTRTPFLMFVKGQQR